MFTGIIESLGTVKELNPNHGNLNLIIESLISHELKIDQSISHNGVCLTVVGIEGNFHTVTAIEETLLKTNLRKLKTGDKINLERCMLVGSRFDGHMVQGHVDQTAICTQVMDKGGSWVYSFLYDASGNNFTVEKGSITVNGTSLTVLDSKESEFSVAIIPYTYENTSIHQVKKGDLVNLEFDILGKYISKLIERQVKANS
jgi:riboflavin synthase